MTAKRTGGSKARSTKARRSRKKKKAGKPWVYRAVEFLLGGAVVAIGGLAVLGQMGGVTRPLFLVAALVGAALASVLVLMLVERARRSVSLPWRHALNGAVFASIIGLAYVSPPADIVHTLQRLLDDERATQMRVVRHQVYAAYRRMDLADQRTVLERSRVFDSTVEEAAEAFGVSHEILMGMAATESSFHPRPSRDGGKGLFQITAVPTAAEAAAKKALDVPRLDPVNQRHNAFLGAATLALYADQMNGDLLLTLLAYNIGPYNGGLRFIVDKYGAQNFAQAQPYLKEHPRDYPIRVLSAALAYRLWKEEGRLPRYEGGEGTTARRIQRLGVPGLDGPEPFAVTASD
ncbi:MAG: transglycosylase SLT domain-containing protein [Candidatus Binatia bacterium]|nr:transglycosylase SLT domain-containing protein [Candidatus Binatia bacterium]